MSLVIIHLTDIHMHEDKSLNPILAKIDALKRACASVINADDEIIITITGDLAYSGREEEYVHCIFLEDIKEYLHTELKVCTHVALVPGNHDCCFPQDTKLRDALIKAVNPKESTTDEQFVNEISKVQENYVAFAELICPAIRKNNAVCSQIIIELGIGKVLITLLNTAWRSEIHEQPGSLCMPLNLLPQINLNDYNLCITLAHHPLGWLHPDNASRFRDYLRTTADILFFGHEHIKDSITSHGQKWSIFQRNGKELQNDKNPEDSGFSIYVIDRLMQTLHFYDFAWDTQKNRYERAASGEEPFSRNLAARKNYIRFNKKTQKILNDPGFLIHHFRVERVGLSDLFCWPDLEAKSNSGDAILTRILIRENIPAHLLQYRLPLIVGNSFVGKTALGKMLCKEYSEQGKCCLLCDGDCFTSHMQDSILTGVDMLFKDQYCEEEIGQFWQLPLDDKVLIIDNFEKIPFSGEKRDKIITLLLTKFKTVILLSGADADLSLLLAMQQTMESDKVTQFNILYMNNQKRRELIRKWFELGDEGMDDDQSINDKIEAAMPIVDTMLGGLTKLMPATPIHVISVLQGLNMMTSSSLKGSGYGYLYDNLIRRSLSEAMYSTDEPTVSIYTTALARIAFEMLMQKKMIFCKEEVEATIKEYREKMKLPIDANDLLKKIQLARIIRIDTCGHYRFRYDYFYYYFAAKHIANHLQDPIIQAHIAHMSKMLHIESYGNIMVFVCHFTNSISIIQSVLDNASNLFKDVQAFDFQAPNTVLDEAYDIIERILIPSEVGNDGDVARNKCERLAIKDKAGISDGSVDEADIEEINDDEEKDREVYNLLSALKTIDVLGQIIRNYPGEIDGDIKIEVLNMIHDLGMRFLQTVMKVFCYFEDDLIKHLAAEAKEDNKNVTAREIAMEVKGMFAIILASFNRSMISRIAYSIGNPYLLPAAQEAYGLPGSISGRLILFDMQFNYIRGAVPYDQAIAYHKELCKSNCIFPSEIFRSIIAEYLRYNECGVSIRDKLCEEFQLPKKKVLGALVDSAAVT